MEKNFISEEDKAILRKVAKYLRSYNMRSGVIQIESDYYNHPESAADNVRNFNNNWSVEVPDFFKPYLPDIVSKCLSKIQDIDIESPNYDNVEFDIDSVDNQLSVTRFYGYEQPGDSSGMTWGDGDEDEMEEIKELISEIKASDAEIGRDGIVRLNFAGSGDSGYIEGAFDGGGRVPSEIEDWCYRMLENNHGGWEINEGSQGYFNFDTVNNIIELEFQYNELVEETDEIISVYFGK